MTDKEIKDDVIQIRINGKVKKEWMKLADYNGFTLTELIERSIDYVMQRYQKEIS